MASGPRPTARPGAGPGRGRTRSRDQSRPRDRVPAAGARPSAPGTDDQPDAPAAPVARPTRGRSITTRAIALAVVLLILTISYANSVRIYFAQSREIAATTAEIAERQNRIGDLQSQLARWDDPSWVRIQARERLGWVIPGETGYKVVDKDGNPVGGGVEITTPQEQEPGPQPAWYSKLWGSVETADQPTPKATTKPKAEKPITASSKPSSSASPR